MLRWILAFLLIALVAAFFGLGGVASLSFDIAGLLVVALVVLVLMGLIFGGFRHRSI